MAHMTDYGGRRAAIRQQVAALKTQGQGIKASAKAGIIPRAEALGQVAGLRSQAEAIRGAIQRRRANAGQVVGRPVGRPVELRPIPTPRPGLPRIIPPTEALPRRQPIVAPGQRGPRL